ncbi:hypothetical protein Emed_005067 [Eimeria media]
MVMGPPRAQRKQNCQNQVVACLSSSPSLSSAAASTQQQLPSSGGGRAAAPGAPLAREGLSVERVSGQAVSGVGGGRESKACLHPHCLAQKGNALPQRHWGGFVLPAEAMAAGVYGQQSRIFVRNLSPRRARLSLSLNSLCIYTASMPLCLEREAAFLRLSLNFMSALFSRKRATATSDGGPAARCLSRRLGLGAAFRVYLLSQSLHEMSLRLWSKIRKV